MINEEKQKKEASTANARNRRIRDAFPTDETPSNAKIPSSDIRIQSDIGFDETLFEEAFFENSPYFDTPTPKKAPMTAVKTEAPIQEKEISKTTVETAPEAKKEAKSEVKTEEKAKEAKEAEEAKEEIPLYDVMEIEAEEILHTPAPTAQKTQKKEPESPKVKSGEEKRAAPKKSAPIPEAEERTEKIITLRPRAHRENRTKKVSVPFKERPLVQKALAFAREYKQELPRNYLLFAPFLPLGVCVLLIFFRILYAIAAPTTGANIYACVAIINVMAFLPLCTIYLRKRPLLSDRMGWKLPTSDKLPLMLLAAVTLFFGAAALTSLSAYFGLTEVRYHLYTFYDIPATTTIAGILFSSVTLAIIPALTEGILCRGIIFAEYQYDNTPLALIMSAVFSTVLQFDPSRIVVGLFCGLLLSTVRMVTNSLSASIAVHMVYNVACLFYEHFFGIMGNQLSEFLILFFLCAIFALISFFFLFGAAEKFCRTYAEEQREINVDLRYSSGIALKDSLKVAFISPTLYFVLIFYFIVSFFV